MNVAKLLMVGTATLTMLSAAWAQDDQNGQVTQVNRLTNTITLRPIQTGTVGANTAGSDQEFKVKDGVSLEDLHAGNRINYSVTDNGGTRTITKYKVQ